MTKLYIGLLILDVYIYKGNVTHKLLVGTTYVNPTLNKINNNKLLLAHLLIYFWKFIQCDLVKVIRM